MAGGNWKGLEGKIKIFLEKCNDEKIVPTWEIRVGYIATGSPKIDNKKSYFSR